MKKVLDQIPSTTDRVSDLINDLLAFIKTPQGSVVQKDLEERAKEVLKVVGHRKKGVSKEIKDRAWKDFTGAHGCGDKNEDMFKYYTHLKGLPDVVKASVVHMMRKAFDAAFNSDAIAEAAEADAMSLFESMGMPETLATYLWSEKIRARPYDDGEPRGSREHREHVALEILKWAVTPSQKEIKKAVADLMDFKPEIVPDSVKKDMKRDKTEDCPPLMSECFLYPLLGKMDARTLLGRMGTLLRALGLTDGEIWRMVDEKKGSDDD